MPDKRFNAYGRRKSDRLRAAAGFFVHFFLMITAVWWLCVVGSIGMAEIIHDICQSHQSKSRVCEGIRGGLITE